MRGRFEDVEVVVTDDGQQAETERVCAAHGVRYIAGPQRGPAANRNHGARLAQGEWIGFIDDDCIPDGHWVQTALKLTATDAQVIEGRTICPDKRDSPFLEIVENLDGGVLWSCNLLVRAETFRALGGFDEDFQEAGGEDMEFAWRVQQRGIDARYAPELKIEHPVRKIGWRALWRRALMIRWISLYQLKTRNEERTIPGLLLIRTLNLGRVTLRRAKELRAGRWRRPLFQMVWEVLTFPILLPYIIYWHCRFRSPRTAE